MLSFNRCETFCVLRMGTRFRVDRTWRVQSLGEGDSRMEWMGMHVVSLEVQITEFGLTKDVQWQYFQLSRYLLGFHLKHCRHAVSVV